MPNTKQTKKLQELRKGDILYMSIPFEENTAEYYNGYRPQDIRGSLYTDKDGQVSKYRYVVVIGCDRNSIMYLPLTSRHASFDAFHQYELHDNSMTSKKVPDMKSYVEVDSLRSVYANPKWDIHYQGKLADNDLFNIMTRLGKRKIDFTSDHDQRAYVSCRNSTHFQKQLEENGYVLTENTFLKKTYEKEDGRTVTKTNQGLVRYHVPLSKEEVTRLVANHEGKPLEFYKGFSEEEKLMDDFSKAVADITKKSSESEVII